MKNTNENLQNEIKRYEELQKKVMDKARSISGKSKLSYNKIFKDDNSDFYIIELLKRSSNVNEYLKSKEITDYWKESDKHENKNRISARFLENKIGALKNRKAIQRNEFEEGIFQAFVSDFKKVTNVKYEGYYWSPQYHRISDTPLELIISIEDNIIKASITNFFDRNTGNDKCFRGKGYFNEQTNKLFINLSYPTIESPSESINLILSTPDSITNIEDFDMVGTLQGISTRNRKPIISMEVYLLRPEKLTSKYKNDRKQLIERYISLRRYGYRVRTLPVKVSKLHVNKERYPVAATSYLIGTYYLIRSKKNGGFKLSTLQIGENLKGLCYNSDKPDGDVCTISTEMINNSKLSLRLKSYNKEGFVTSIMYLRWSLDFDTTLLSRFNCVDGMITILRNREMHQSPFIMYKVSESIGEKNSMNKPLKRIKNLDNEEELIEEVKDFRDGKEALRLIEFTKKHYPYLFR